MVIVGIVMVVLNSPYKIIVGIVLVALVYLLAITLMMWLVVETAKESRVTGEGVVVSGADDATPVQTASLDTFVGADGALAIRTTTGGGAVEVCHFG